GAHGKGVRPCQRRRIREVRARDLDLRHGHALACGDRIAVLGGAGIAVGEALGRRARALAARADIALGTGGAVVAGRRVRCEDATLHGVVDIVRARIAVVAVTDSGRRGRTGAGSRRSALAGARKVGAIATGLTGVMIAVRTGTPAVQTAVTGA